jgi:hypothetical protein
VKNNHIRERAQGRGENLRRALRYTVFIARVLQRNWTPKKYIERWRLLLRN